MDLPGFNPPGIPSGGVGFDSLYRCGYSGISPPCPPGAGSDFGPSAIRQTEPITIADMSIETSVRNAEHEARSGRIDAAIGSLRVLLRVHPNHPLATRALGMLLLQSGRTDEARRVLQRMVDVAPKVPEHRNNLANVLAAAGAHAEAAAK